MGSMAGDRSRNGNRATVHPLAAATVAEPDGTGPMTGVHRQSAAQGSSSIRASGVVERRYRWVRYAALARLARWSGQGRRWGMLLSAWLETYKSNTPPLFSLLTYPVHTISFPPSRYLVPAANSPPPTTLQSLPICNRLSSFVSSPCGKFPLPPPCSCRPPQHTHTHRKREAMPLETLQHCR